MEKFFKIYVPVIAVLLYFSGFNFLASYLQYFGLTAAYLDVGIEDFAFNSFVVLYHLLLFTYPEYSLAFLGLIFFVSIVFTAPRRTVAVFSGETNWLTGKPETREIDIFPQAARIICAAIPTFLVLFNLSARIGIEEGCKKLTQRNVAVRIYGLKDKLLQKDAGVHTSNDQFEEFREYNRRLALTEVWRTDSTVFIARRLEECEDGNLKKLYELPVGSFKFLIVNEFNDPNGGTG